MDQGSNPDNKFFLVIDSFFIFFGLDEYENFFFGTILKLADLDPLKIDKFYTSIEFL
jgi:hypothetical protein